MADRVGDQEHFAVSGTQTQLLEHRELLDIVGVSLQCGGAGLGDNNGAAERGLWKG